MTSFNGMVLDNLVKVEDIRLDVMPPIRSDIAEGVTRSFFRSKSFEPRHAEIDVRMIETDHKTVIDKAKQLAAVLHVDEPKQLITRRRPNEFIMAMPNGSFPIEQLLSTGFAELDFICDEGVYYSTELFEGLASATNQGTLPAKPFLTFTAAGATHTISNGVRSLFFEGLSAGDIVTVDTLTGKVTVNGGSGNVYESLASRSDLFELPVGEWALTGATATYRERSL